MVSFFGTETSPSSGVSSPVIIRNSVVLPEPFGPTRPTFSPGFSWNEASTKRTCLPYCLLTRAKEIMGTEEGSTRRATLGSGMKAARYVRRGLVLAAAVVILGLMALAAFWARRAG